MKKIALLVFVLSMQFLSAVKAQTLEMVKDIHTTGNSFPNNLTVAGNKLFFLASDNSGFQKLWVTQGSEATTVLLLDKTLLQIQKLYAYKGKIYFDCYTPTYGQELWVSDGTVAGTHLFVDIYPGTTGSFPSAFTVCNNKLFFMCNSVNGERRLFATDGTVAGTIVIRDYYINLFNGLTNFAVLNNEIFFTSDGGTGPYVYGMWKSDGTLGGTVLVKPGIASSVGGDYTVLNNTMYFSAADDSHGTELWSTDGTTAGTNMVINLNPDPPGGGVFYSGAPQHLTVYKSKLYFHASDGVNGQEFYTSDGTAAGTKLVKDIRPGTDGSSGGEIAIYNGLMYFTCYLTGEMWQSDGTTAGTKLVKNNMADYVWYPAIFNNKMYITSRTIAPILQSDGTTAGTGNMTVSNSASIVEFYGADLHFVEYEGSVYFSGACGSITRGYELCKLSASVPTSFSFTGSGNWSNPANWAGGIVPPATLPAGSTVTITGNCILDVTQHIAMGASLIVATGATLVINGSLTMT